MDLRELKRDFGRDLVFWGGGVIFAPVHDIQADVPPQNIMPLQYIESIR